MKIEVDNRNVVAKYKNLATDLIKENVKKESIPFSFCMMHMQSDFNISSVLRSANALGAHKAYYFGGKKHFDKRGACGVFNYCDFTHLKTLDELKELKKEFTFIALEQTEKSVNLTKFHWPKNKPSLILIGEEGAGLDKEILDLCDSFVEIVQRGSVRSLNAASAATVAFYDFASKYETEIYNGLF